MQSIYCICLDRRYVLWCWIKVTLETPINGDVRDQICPDGKFLLKELNYFQWKRILKCPIECWRGIQIENDVFFKSVSHYHAHQLLIKLANKLTLLSFWVQNDWWLQCNVACAAAPLSKYVFMEAHGQHKYVPVMLCVWLLSLAAAGLELGQCHCGHVNGNKYCTVQQLLQFALLFSESVHIETLLTADLCTNRWQVFAQQCTLNFGNQFNLSASTFWVDFTKCSFATQRFKIMFPFCTHSIGCLMFSKSCKVCCQIRLLKRKPAGNHKATDGIAPGVSTPVFCPKLCE